MATVALLRGVNVGGARKLPMKDLRALCGELGFTGVRTYIASGNLFWDGVEAGSPAASASSAATLLHDAIEERWGYDVPVVVRSRAQLEAVRAANPFPDAAEEKWLHVMFLDREPAPDAVAGLDPDRQPGDRYAVRGSAIYVDYANGAGRSKVTADWFERQLGVRGTARNWRTLGKLIELA